MLIFIFTNLKKNKIKIKINNLNNIITNINSEIMNSYQKHTNLFNNKKNSSNSNSNNPNSSNKDTTSKDYSTAPNKTFNRDILCTNCGSKTHVYKQCHEPIASWGVILVTYGDLIKPVHDKVVDLCESDMSETQSRVLIESNTDRRIVSSAYHSIKFLMISRKHSVGKVEFMRGRYRPEKIDQTIYLFKQMKQVEIDEIKYYLSLDDGHEYMWRDFWGSKADSPYLANDKRVSKTNYEMLKTKGVDGPELDLHYIVSTVKAEYDTEEWGFPKGRKNRSESELDCAIREFKEESGYTDDDFKLIHEIKPLVEIFNGTNGITYKHVYYVAELISDKDPRNGITESQRDEIGNIQFMDFPSAIEYIRDYHIPRKALVGKLFTYYLDKLVLSNRQCNNVNNDNNESDSEQTILITNDHIEN